MSAIAFFVRSSSQLVVTATLLVLLPACKTMENESEETPGLIDQPTFALIDLDNDGKVSPSEMAKHKHQEGLAEFDLDNDRQISLSEWKAAKPSSPENDGSFKQLDRNNDGKVTEDEAILSITEHAPFGEAFKATDANGDGHLHWEEYSSGNPASLNVTLFSMTPGTAAPVDSESPAQ